MRLRTVWDLIRNTFHDWSEDKAPRLAAALSYYTVFSLAPLLVLIIAITGFIIGNNATIRNQILTQVQGLVGQQGSQAVNTLITNSSKPAAGILATVIGVITLLLGATGLFGQLQDALNTIWEVQPKEGRGVIGIIKDRFLSFTMVLGVSFLLLVSLVISTALSVLNHYFAGLLGGAGWIAQALNIVVSLAIITLIFALIFKYLPDVKISWGDVWVGALVTAILFTIGKQLLSLYLGSTSSTSVYGAAGSLVILLLWVYYSAQILFMGAEFTQVYARFRGSQIVPSENARPMTEAERSQQGIRSKRRPEEVQKVQQAMLPITGQPEIHPVEGHAEGGTVITREKVRYEPPNPNTVIPVIAGGALASVYTVGRIAREVMSAIQGSKNPRRTFRRY